jgi:GDP-L-fucose synthase
VAKIAGIKLCQAYRRQYGSDFISIMPTNLYGPGDNFDVLQGHVVPGLMEKAHRAKLGNADAIETWGTGRPTRELLYVDDAADGMVFVMKNYSQEEIINIGTGEEISIADLTALICRVVGFKGEIRYDHTKPDGTPRKVVDTSRLRALGWQPRMRLAEGLERTYRWYLEHVATARERHPAYARA